MTKLATAKQSPIPFIIFCSILLAALATHHSLQSNQSSSNPTSLPQSSSDSSAAKPTPQPVALNEFKQS